MDNEEEPIIEEISEDLNSPRVRARYALFVTDAELIRRLGVPEKIARGAIRSLDANRVSGFPPKQKFWGSRRYWPAVRAYFDRVNKVEAGRW